MFCTTANALTPPVAWAIRTVCRLRSRLTDYLKSRGCFTT